MTPEEEYKKAEFLFAHKHFAQAKEVYSDLIQKNHQKKNCYNRRAICFEFEQDNESAIRDHSWCIELDPKMHVNYANRGSCRIANGEYHHAIDDYVRAHELHPKESNYPNQIGICCAHIERNEKALQHYDEAIALDPNDHFYHLNRGLALQKLGRIEEAIQSYDDAIRLEPVQSDAYFEKAYCYESQKKYEEAARHYLVCTQVEPQVAINFEKAAFCLVECKHHKKAVAIYDHLILCFECESRIYYRRGMCFLHLKKFEKAVADFQVCTGNDSNNLRYLNSLAIALRDSTRYVESLVLFQKCLSINPDYVCALEEMSVALRFLERYEDALFHLKKVISLNHRSASTLNEMGLCYESLKQYDEAIEKYTECISMNRGYAFYYNRGRCYYQIESYECAVVDFEECVKVRDTVSARARLGCALCEIGHYSEAASEHSTCIEREPTNYEHYLFRGMCFRYLKRYEQAMQDFERSDELKPNNPVLYNEKGLYFDQRKQWSRALFYFGRAVELSPTNELFCENQGWAHYNLGNYKKAIESYDQCVALNDGRASVYMKRSSVFGRLNQNTKRLSDITRAIDLDPDNELYIRNRGDLLYKMGRFEEALADYDEVIEIAHNTCPYSEKAQCYEKMIRPREAIECHNKAVESDPTNLDILQKRAFCLFGYKQYSEAAMDFGKILKLSPEILGVKQMYNLSKRGTSLSFEKILESLAQTNQTESVPTAPPRVVVVNTRREFLDRAKKANKSISLCANVNLSGGTLDAALEKPVTQKTNVTQKTVFTQKTSVAQQSNVVQNTSIAQKVNVTQDPVTRLKEQVSKCGHCQKVIFSNQDLVQLQCTQKCKMDCHVKCWNSYKRDSKSTISCFTPDCGGVFSKCDLFNCTTQKTCCILEVERQDSKKTEPKEEEPKRVTKRVPKQGVTKSSPTAPMSVTPIPTSNNSITLVRYSEKDLLQQFRDAQVEKQVTQKTGKIIKIANSVTTIRLIDSFVQCPSSFAPDARVEQVVSCTLSNGEVTHLNTRLLEYKFDASLENKDDPVTIFVESRTCKTYLESRKLLCIEHLNEFVASKQMQGSLFLGNERITKKNAKWIPNNSIITF